MRENVENKSEDGDQVSGDSTVKKKKDNEWKTNESARPAPAGRQVAGRLR